MLTIVSLIENIPSVHQIHTSETSAVKSLPDVVSKYIMEKRNEKKERKKYFSFDTSYKTIGLLLMTREWICDSMPRRVLKIKALLCSSLEQGRRRGFPQCLSLEQLRRRAQWSSRWRRIPPEEAESRAYYHLRAHQWKPQMNQPRARLEQAASKTTRSRIISTINDAIRFIRFDFDSFCLQKSWCDRF